VDWYPWGKEAFDRAKTESKPIMVSILSLDTVIVLVVKQDNDDYDG